MTPGRPRRPGVPRGPYLVVGLGRAGLAAAAALADVAGPSSVRACDSATPAHAVEQVEALRARGVEIETHSDGLALLVREPPPRCVVKSPGVPLDAALIAAARERGAMVIDELELGWRLSDAPAIAITGTNGKSTTSHLIAAMHGSAGLDAPLVGNFEFGPPLSAAWATPCDRLVCEVSSYQLEGSPSMLPEAAVLTNLRPDHLDRHGTMRRYAACKRRLFMRGDRTTRLAILPADDRFGATLARELARHDAVVWRFGTRGEAEFRITRCDWTARSARLWADTPDGPVELEHRLPGEHNAMNVMAAVAAARGLGVTWDAIARALARTPGVPGRFETISSGQPFEVIVDFAHTPDAVESVLRAIRAIAARRRGRVLASISTSGHRPTALAPLMGEAAARLVDFLVVTAGSLRGAPVEEVVGPLAMGARAAGSTAQVAIEPDRRLAIRRVLAAAQHDDVVAILGRGARQTLSSGASVGAGPRFDDRQVAREELDLLLAGGAQPARATTRA